MNKHLWCAATLAFFAAAAAPAMAQEVNEGWSVTVTPYVWAPGYDSDIKNNATGETIESSRDFSDWISDLRSIPLIVKGEAQYNRVGVFGDLIYLPLSSGSTIDRPILGPIEVDNDLTLKTVTGAGFYRVYQTDQLNIDLLGGFRYVEVELDVDVNGPGAGSSRDASPSFTEAIVGVRATQRLGTKTSVTGYGDYGGFGGSKTVWQLIGTFNYQWAPKVTVLGGYRHFDIEIEGDRLSADVTFSGPLIGVTYRF